MVNKDIQSKNFGPHLWEINVVKDIFWLAVFLFLLLLMFRLKTVFAPVFTGLFLAYLFNPAVSFAERKLKVSRVVTVSAIIGILVFGGALFIIWFSPLITDQVKILAKKVPGYIEYLNTKYSGHSELIKNKVFELLNKLKYNPAPLLNAFFEVVYKTTNTLLWVFLVPLFFFFFSWKFDSMINELKQYLPATRKERIIDIVSRMDKAFGDFFRGRVIISIFIGFLLSFALWFANVPYWFLLGMTAGILNIVPYLISIGWAVTIIITYLDYTAGSGLKEVMWLNVFVWPTVAFVAVNIIDNWILTPWIQSKSLHLSVVSLLVVVLAGGIIGGFPGLLFAIPVASCMKILFVELILPKLKKLANS